MIHIGVAHGVAASTLEIGDACRHLVAISGICQGLVQDARAEILCDELKFVRRETAQEAPGLESQWRIST